MFESAGLGQLIQSWIGGGPNQSVSPEQLRNVFGGDRISGMAAQSGLPEESFLSQLSHHLPAVVDQLTPGGKLPDEGSTGGVRLAHLIQCAPKARTTSGGRIHPESCR